MDSYLRIRRPVKTNRKTQSFNENRACSVIGVRPFKIKGVVRGVCPAGTEPFYKALYMKGHNGEDWATWYGEPLYFPVECPDAGGWYSMEASDADGGLGVDVVSNNEVTIDGVTSHLKFRFWHMKNTWKDADVQLGDIIGRCDSTGASGGNHLHWSMKRCDKDGVALDKDNGYYGAIDFSKYYTNEFILEYLKIRGEALSVIEKARQLIAGLKAFIANTVKSVDNQPKKGVMGVQ